MTPIEFIVRLKKDFPLHEFKFVEMINPDSFYKQYVISVDGILNKIFTVSWNESIFSIVNLNYEDLKKKVKQILQGEKNG